MKTTLCCSVLRLRAWVIRGTVAFILSTAVSIAQPFEIIAWNIESGDSSMSWVASKIKRHERVHLWGLSEVPSNAAPTLEAAADSAGEDFMTLLGTTGGEDRLMVLYSTERFDFLGKQELHNVNISGTVRSPLVVKLRDKPSNQEFFFMVNHLYRSNNSARHQQAKLINQWAAQQTIPIVTVGDFNFDWEVVGGDTNHDLGYDHMIANGVFKWVRPTTLVRTQFGSNFTSVLDFVFVSNRASSWTGESVILQEPGDEPDSSEKSDHRPVWAKFTLSALTPTPAPAVSTQADRNQEIIQRLEALEREIQGLKAKVVSPL